MSRYEKLWEHLQSDGSSSLKLSFEEIGSITGFAIDHSFLSFKKESIQFEYSVGKISLKEKHVTFNRLNS